MPKPPPQPLGWALEQVGNAAEPFRLDKSFHGHFHMTYPHRNVEPVENVLNRATDRAADKVWKRGFAVRNNGHRPPWFPSGSG